MNMNTHCCEVETAFQTFITELTRIQDSAQHQFEEFKRSKATQQLKVRKCADVCLSKQIKLDIGGTLFKTTEETLLSQKDTFFTAMLSGPWEPDPDTGTYFIDRNAEKFGSILDYLRTGELPCIDGWTIQDQKLFERDMDFYGLASPFRICWDVSATGSQIQTLQAGRSHAMQMHISDEVLNQNVITWCLTCEPSELDWNLEFAIPYGARLVDTCRIRLYDGNWCYSDRHQWGEFAHWGNEETRQIFFRVDKKTKSLTVTVHGEQRVVQPATLQPHSLPYLFTGASIPKCHIQAV